jgi:maltooligosyltrehalose trehalohydrolase
MSPGLPPQGAQAGLAGVHYRVWAPVAREAAVEVVDGTGRVLRTMALAPGGGRGYFHGHDESGRAGDRYRFSLDGKNGLPDPASRWQPEGVHGPSMVIDASVYPWRDGAWKRPRFRDLVIYEMHVGAFTQAGTFAAAVEKLPAIRECGVNAIELMPIAEFAGGRNWGYDGVCWFAPSRAYGHPDDLRGLVDAAHGLGLAVILDVVYNHLGPDGSYLHEYIGEYLDEDKKTPWGGAIRYGDVRFQPLRELVIANPSYWMREFHIDGFRLDATHAIVDDSPRHILQELTAAIHAGGGYAIAEDPRNDVRLVRCEGKDGLGFDAVWADDFHHVVRVANTGEAEGYLGDFSGKLEEAVDTLRHGWFYRGQVAKSAGAPRGTECREASPEAFVHCISNHDQTGNHAFGERLSHRILPAALRAAEALICLTPYTPMIFMGQEWAASTPFLFFTDHHPELGQLIVEGRREEFKHFAAFNEPEMLEKIPNPQKPSSFEASKLVWEERTRGKHGKTLALYKECLALRASNAAFRPESRDAWAAEALTMGVGVLMMQGKRGCWAVLFDLKGGHEGNLKVEKIFAAQDMKWNLILSSNEVRFGGTGKCAVDPRSMAAHFTKAETVVLYGERV